VRSNNRISLQTKDHNTRKKKMTSMNPLIASHYPATPKPSEGGSLLTILRRRPSFILIALVLGVFTLGQRAQAAVPAPDGGYAGGNTAEGQAALFSLTNGTYNTGVGLFSLRSNTEGSLNTAIGAGTLLVNTGSRNTATGAGALLSNTTAEGNTANGTFALFSNTIGENNTANGAFALFSSTQASGNTANGNHALFSNTTGAQNTAIGLQALLNNTTGTGNTANGAFALFAGTTGEINTAFGVEALFNNTTGSNNTANGAFALESNTTGEGNTANGAAALATNIDGFQNTAIGAHALFQNTAGSNNTAIGFGAGELITGNGNVCIGAFFPGVPGESNTTRIKNIATTALNTGMLVEVDADGKLGFITSSRRYKHEIEPMDKASEALFALKPVTFRYNGDIDPAHVKMFGLIAEDVAKVSPDLAVRNAKGEVDAIRFDSINAMLLNEFLKEHKKVEEQQAAIAELKSTVAQQQKGMEVMMAQLKEQAALIQKVSAQIETSKSAPQVVINP
jgi:uncharacterized coiled-coil protein SlyX